MLTQERIRDRDNKREAFVERLIQDTISGAISWHDHEAEIPGGSVFLGVFGERRPGAGKSYNLGLHVDGMPEDFQIVVKRPLLIALDVAIRNASYAERRRKEEYFYDFIDEYLCGGR